jgi:hypothetical protein
MSFPEQIACHLNIARTGDVDLDFSTALQEVSRFALKMFLQEKQCTFFILIEQDLHQLDDVLILQNNLKILFHRLYNPIEKITNKDDGSPNHTEKCD